MMYINGQAVAPTNTVDGGNIGYKVTFKINNADYYIASCLQGESISSPPTATAIKWVDSNGNTVTFPFTPTADVELYAVAIQETLLCHCDDYTDSGANQFILLNNGVDVDTSIKKFGTGSWHFVENTDFVQVDNPSTYFDFGTNDFTIDFWLYPTAFTGAIISAWRTNPRAFILTTAGTAGLLFAFAYGGTTSSKLIQTGDNVLTLNVWQHIAVTRDGSEFYIFVNGNMVKTYTTAESINPLGSGNPLYVGKNTDTGTTDDHTTGYIDEIRILNGTCAWTEDFLPPTHAY